MLNEFVIKFRCKHCKKPVIRVFPCNGQLSVMKAGLKAPDRCKCCDKLVWEIIGILNVDVGDKE